MRAQVVSLLPLDSVARAASESNYWSRERAIERKLVRVELAKYSFILSDMSSCLLSLKTINFEKRRVDIF